MLHEWYFYKNVYSSQACADILSIAKDNSSAVYADVYGKASNKNVEVSVIETKVFDGALDLFFDFVYTANEQIFGFDLFSTHPRAVNLNKYGVEQEYPMHKDGMFKGSSADVKLTAILNLSNEEFTGGDFEFFVGQLQKVPEINDQGSILIFPSFLYHRVTPVLSGNRVSLSCWFTGRNWK